MVVTSLAFFLGKHSHGANQEVVIWIGFFLNWHQKDLRSKDEVMLPLWFQ
jgi:hypothetical protein